MNLGSSYPSFQDYRPASLAVVPFYLTVPCYVTQAALGHAYSFLSLTNDEVTAVYHYTQYSVP